MMTSTTQTAPFTTVLPAHIRPLRPGDGLEVRRLFRATITRARSRALEYADIVAHERLCVDWYLTEGRADVRVVEQGGEIVGYLLVCLRQADYEAWARRYAVRWAGRMAYRLVTGRLRGEARRFAGAQARDRLTDRWDAPPRPFAAHAHVYLAPHVCDDEGGRRLIGAVDELVRTAGLAGWCGDVVDVPGGSSLRAFERAGARVVRRVPDHASSWAHGAPVRRASVVRSLTDLPMDHGFRRDGPPGRPRVEA